MRYLLDANIIILSLSGSMPNLRQRLAASAEDDLATSAIAFAEVAHGSRNGKAPSTRVLERWTNKVPVLAFDTAAAKAYAALRFKRLSYDRLIAAHAISLGLIVVTNNEANFDDIPGLRVEDWTR